MVCCERGRQGLTKACFLLGPCMVLRLGVDSAKVEEQSPIRAAAVCVTRWCCSAQLLSHTTGVCVTPLVSLYYPLEEEALLALARHAFHRAAAPALSAPSLVPGLYPGGPAGGTRLLAGYVSRDWGEGGGGSVASEGATALVSVSFHGPAAAPSRVSARLPPYV